MPEPKIKPEVQQPADPDEPEIPQENPDRTPDELPAIENSPQKGGYKPGQSTAW